MARFVRHEPCPECGSKDNFGRYDDGGGFCFGCHYHQPATHAPMRHMGQQVAEKYHHALPDDIGHHYSREAVEWLASFHVDLTTAIRREVVWSPSAEQLIFKLGNYWQARNFNPARRAKSKNFTSGDVNECTHIYGCVDGGSGGDPVQLPQTLVIVEDPISALRVASVCDAMPLLGSHLATARLCAIARLYSSLVFWLDSDKLKESQAMAQRAKYMGLSTRVIWTPEDPKCHTTEQIKELLI